MVKVPVVTLKGEPVTAVYLVALGSSVVGAGGVIVRVVSMAVRVVFQVPKEGLSVRLVAPIAEMVPVGVPTDRPWTYWNMKLFEGDEACAVSVKVPEVAVVVKEIEVFGRSALSAAAPATVMLVPF